MADVFLSYAREDLEQARQLAQALTGQGWSVFWDRTIPAGETWREYIGAQLEQARCVVVAWSKTSISSRWVQEEADEGLQRDALVPVLFEPVTPPLGFRSIQAEDLSSWDGSETSWAFRKLIDDITRLLPLPSSAQTPTQLQGTPERSTELEQLIVDTMLDSAYELVWDKVERQKALSLDDLEGWFHEVPKARKENAVAGAILAMDLGQSSEIGIFQAVLGREGTLVVARQIIVTHSSIDPEREFEYSTYSVDLDRDEYVNVYDINDIY